jgi:hypothetical protein
MLKKIAISLAIALGVLIAVIATRPATFRLQRSTTIAAPAEVVFAQINDFRKWGTWSPWEKIDPNLKRTYGGAASGVGADYAWAGNNQVGEGRMTITASQPNERIAIRLEFLAPFAATNEAEFTLKPAPGGVGVTWSMSGNNNFVAKAFSLFVDMDSLVGKDFEAGLAALKSVAEH